MPGASVKLKTLYLMKILLEKTDEEHWMSAADLIKELGCYDQKADRKTIYGDMDTLREFGLDVIQKKGSNAGYYIGSRKFELPELRFLVDVVQSSKFITNKKSQELIGKLESLSSVYEARSLQRQVYIYNRTKTENETIYYNVDMIHSAILKNRKISFCYAEWTVKKKLKLRKNGKRYEISPWAMTLDDDNYYLVAYDEQADLIKHYRVDKIQKMEIMEEPRLGKEKFQDFDITSFVKKTFGMFGGRDVDVVLRCDNSLVGVILDRFGKNVMLVPEGEEHFRVKLSVVVSPQFFGWLTGIGSKMQIVSPEDVKEEYREYLQEILQVYKGEES